MSTLQQIKEWRDNAEIMGEIKYCDEVNWLIRRVELLEDAVKPAYVEPVENGRDLVMTEPVKDHVFSLRADIENLRDEMKQISLALGRSKTDGESDCDWFDLAGDVNLLRQALRWCRNNYPAIRASDDVHFCGKTIEDLAE